MRLRCFLAAMLAVVTPAYAAAPPSQPGYQVNLGIGPSSPSFIYGEVPMWIDTSNLTVNPAGLPRPTSAEYPMPMVDRNSASYTSWPTLAAVSGVYTPPAGTRKLVANVTSAGNVVLTDPAGNTWTIALAVGSSDINAVPVSFTTTATATFLAPK